MSKPKITKSDLKGKCTPSHVNVNVNRSKYLVLLRPEPLKEKDDLYPKRMNQEQKCRHPNVKFIYYSGVPSNFYFQTFNVKLVH